MRYCVHNSRRARPFRTPGFWMASGIHRRRVFASLAAVTLLVTTSILPVSRLRSQDRSFLRGDANGDSKVDVSDALFTLEFLFLGGPEPTCLDAGDSNDDGVLNLADAITTVRGILSSLVPLTPPGKVQCSEDQAHNDSGSTDGVREGWIAGPNGPVWAKYTWVDGVAVFEGDIVVQVLDRPLAGDRRLKSALAGDAIAKWPNGVIPFAIDPDLSDWSRAHVNDAIQHWNTNTVVELVPRTAGDENFVTFRPWDKPWSQSNVGMVGGEQSIDLGATSTALVIHEIGHTVGLWHEHSRSDRDDWIDIIWENVQDGKEHNFETLPEKYLLDWDTYDYASIMHYSAFAFSKNGQPTLEPLQALPPGVVLGQGDALSAGDRAGVAAMYYNAVYRVENRYIGSFARWAVGTNVKAVAGDFDGDRRDDVALTGGSGWTTLPVALSRGNGSFSVLNRYIGSFAGWAARPNVKAVTGDFDNDGKDDIALTGGTGWSTLPVAFSRGDGRFRVENRAIYKFAGWAAETNVKVVAGDFDNDGNDDIALTGGSGWTTLPVAFSRGDGTFSVVYRPVGSFAGWAARPNVQAVAGDFDGDGRDDVALTGGWSWVTLGTSWRSWDTVPVAFSRGRGAFSVVNRYIGSFARWAVGNHVQAVAGDFNRDGRADVALTGGASWESLPVALSNGAGGFAVVNRSIDRFAGWAARSEVTALAGDFDGNGLADVALTGGSNWSTLPVAFSMD